MRQAVLTEPTTKQRTDLCASCKAAGACLPRADLHTVAICRDLLVAEYGWDMFSMAAEAKNKYLTARASDCPQLDDVKKEAESVAPEVDFDRL